MMMVAFQVTDPSLACATSLPEAALWPPSPIAWEKAGVRVDL